MNIHINIKNVHKHKINQGVMVVGRRPSVEDNLWWKTTFGGRRPKEEDLSVEDDFCWRTTYGGRQPSVEDYLR